MISSTENSISRQTNVSCLNRSIPALAQALSKGFFIEVNCRTLSESIVDQLANEVYRFVQKQKNFHEKRILTTFVNESLLNLHVNRIYFDEIDENRLKRQEMNIILYQTKNDDPFVHQLNVEGEKHEFGRRWTLPHQALESIWECLQFDSPFKCQLMQYVFTLIRFAKSNIDRTILLSNQTILLYGPPGSGKTSLCKGLAQKISIRMKELFDRFYFFELNSSSIFSKWFSESSHNLSKFFDEIVLLSSDRSTFVIVLIDEIESLSYSRNNSLTSNEPSDMFRVVNTLLTQIDRLKSFSNILILTTSNFIEIIDRALIDRIDLILFIGSPSTSTILYIYQQCFQELIDKQLIHSSLISLDHLQSRLLSLAQLSQGLSGRTIRKLPFIAFSHIEQGDQSISLEQLVQAIQQQLQDQQEHSFQHAL